MKSKARLLQLAGSRTFSIHGKSVLCPIEVPGYRISSASPTAAGSPTSQRAPSLLSEVYVQARRYSKFVRRFVFATVDVVKVGLNSLKILAESAIKESLCEKCIAEEIFSRFSSTYVSFRKCDWYPPSFKALYIATRTF